MRSPKSSSLHRDRTRRDWVCRGGGCTLLGCPWAAQIWAKKVVIQSPALFQLQEPCHGLPPSLASQTSWRWYDHSQGDAHLPSSMQRPFPAGSSPGPAPAQAVWWLHTPAWAWISTAVYKLHKAKPWPHKHPGRSPRAWLPVCAGTCLHCQALQLVPSHTGSLR